MIPLKRRADELSGASVRAPNLKVLITERWGAGRSENDINSMIIGDIKARRLKFGAPQTIDVKGKDRAVLRYALERDAAAALYHFRTPGVWVNSQPAF